MKKEIGSRIKQLREHLGLSQSAFGKEIGLSFQHVSRYERGEVTPSGELLIKMYEAFNVNLNWLLTGEGDSQKVIQALLGTAPGQTARVSEDLAVYTVKDRELMEIIDLLQHDLPEAKKTVLKLLKARKELKQGMQDLQNMDDSDEEAPK